MTRRDYEKRNLNWIISVGILTSRRDYDQLNFGCRDYDKRNLNWRISVGILISRGDCEHRTIIVGIMITHTKCFDSAKSAQML